MHEFKVAIIGAGPAGLSLARYLKELNINYQQFEANSNVGGVWDINAPDSPMYESAHFISSKTQSNFPDYPMPTHYPDYPSNTQIFDYILDFANHFKLIDNIQFNHKVIQARYENELWKLDIEDKDNKVSQQSFNALICANGVNWYPFIPEFKGEFTGEIRHSVTYTRAEEFKNKRVLIVGAGNSGCDIACDAAQSAKYAAISMRRGYHFLPKHLFGKPTDVFDASGPKLPMWLKQIVMPLLIKLTIGKPESYGLPKPDHKIFATHPIMNSQLMHYLAHGDIQVKADIEHFEGNTVVFKDGSQDEFDLVLLATGYQSRMPFLDESQIDYKERRPDFYLNMFSRKNPTLMGIGFFETNSAAYRLFDAMAHTISQYLKDLRDNTQQAKAFQEKIQTDSPDLSGGVSYVKSQRHANYVNKDRYRDYLKTTWKKMGWGKSREYK